MIITLEEYQNSEMSGQLAELLKNPVLAIAMQVADQSAPVNAGARITEIPHESHIQPRRDRGYAMYPNVLRLLATAPPGSREVEATYEGEEKTNE